MPPSRRYFALIRLIPLALLLLPSMPAAAFGPLGHRVVGLLAERQLSPAATTQVTVLLADEPEPSLAGVANWADQLRDTDPERGRRTARWHYVNFPRGDCVYAPARDCPDGNCVVAAINRNFLALADRSRPRADRAEALKFLVHLVGDVHQPLHAGYRDDRGGNDFQISYRDQGWNLHGVWDSLIVDSRRLDATAYADVLAQQPPVPSDATRHSDRRTAEWAQESCRIVQQSDLYPATHALPESYVTTHRALAEQRLRQAGARLADMINFALRAPVAGANR
jgi:hypothetical protein